MIKINVEQIKKHYTLIKKEELDMKKLGYLAGASLLFVPMPLYAAGIGSSNQVFTHTGWFSVICMATIGVGVAICSKHQK